MITAEILCDSVSPQGHRLTTMKLVYPRFIHAEFMTHRVFSRNASSSRAVPSARLIEEVRSDARAAPVWWGKNQPGMQAAEEMSGRFECLNGWWNSYKHLEGATVQEAWAEAAEVAADIAEAVAEAGAHKQIVNRILEPFTHIRVVVSATEWDNFFGQRLHKDAQPEMRALAGAMWEMRKASFPETLRPGMWHLPFMEARDLPYGSHRDDGRELTNEERIRISVARCARVSYESFETGKRSTVEEDLALYAKLVGAQPMHASPAEHQATPDEWMDYKQRGWLHPHEHGNLWGWRQLRQMLPGQAAAPLPEGYAD